MPWPSSIVSSRPKIPRRLGRLVGVHQQMHGIEHLAPDRTNAWLSRANDPLSAWNRSPTACTSSSLAACVRRSYRRPASRSRPRSGWFASASPKRSLMSADARLRRFPAGSPLCSLASRWTIRCTCRMDVQWTIRRQHVAVGHLGGPSKWSLSSRGALEKSPSRVVRT